MWQFKLYSLNSTCIYNLSTANNAMQEKALFFIMGMVIVDLNMLTASKNLMRSIVNNKLSCIDNQKSIQGHTYPKKYFKVAQGVKQKKCGINKQDNRLLELNDKRRYGSRTCQTVQDKVVEVFKKTIANNAKLTKELEEIAALSLINENKYHELNDKIRYESQPSQIVVDKVIEIFKKAITNNTRLTKELEKIVTLYYLNENKYRDLKDKVRYGSKYSQTVQDKAFEIFKRAITSDARLTKEFEEIAALYSFNEEQGFNKFFYVNDKPSFTKMPQFGIALLKAYAYNNSHIRYLEIVEDMIRTIDKKLEPFAKTINKKVPWGLHWYEISVTFTRMLATYEYIGGNEAVKRICHKIITQIVPKLNTSFGVQKNGYPLVYIAIPRLLTNYLYDCESFSFDIESDSFKEINDTLNVRYRNDDEIGNGIYSDHSSIFHDDVVTYNYMLETYGFYTGSFRALGFDTDMEEFIDNHILRQLLHPDMPYITFGLFGRTGRLAYSPPTYNREIKFEYGVHIIPFAGIGVFKSKKFMFSLRVQRSGMAAYESDLKNTEYALGWMQIRKLYLTGIDRKNKVYGLTTDLKKLKNQPGVLSYDEGNDNIYEFKSNRSLRKVYPTKVFFSHVGRLVEDTQNEVHKLACPEIKHRLLFWLQSYKFSEVYKDTVISEYGVVTENGIVMRYFIENKENRTLRLKIKDFDNTELTEFEADPPSDKNGYVLVKPKSVTTILWRMVFDLNKEPKKINWNYRLSALTFKFNDNEYFITNREAKYYTLTDKNKKVIIGSNSSIRNDIYKTDDNKTTYRRDPETLMYLPWTA